jgi:hypothetical protein
MNNTTPDPVDWDRQARRGLRVALRGTAWLLSAAGVFMEITSKTLNHLSERSPSEPPKPDGK